MKCLSNLKQILKIFFVPIFCIEYRKSLTNLGLELTEYERLYLKIVF